jgi:Cu-processing system permease protein
MSHPVTMNSHGGDGRTGGSTTLMVARAGLRDLARNRWIIGYAAAFFAITEGLFWFGGTGAQVMVSLLSVELLIVPLVALVFGTIHVYASREFIELMLAQPIARTRLFAGVYIGLAAPLSLAFLLGAGVPFLLNLRVGADPATIAALLIAGIALSLIFGGIATWIALRTDDRLKGVGLALGVWLLTTIVYDGVVLGVAAALGDWPIEKPLLFLMAANPVDLARVFVLTRLDVPALMGYTGALFEHTFGTNVGVLAASLALIAWCAAPYALSARRFRRRDF